jgi:hypothetical protein
MLLHVSVEEKKIRVRSGNREAMQSALDVQSTFLGMLRSTAAGHLPLVR